MKYCKRRTNFKGGVMNKSVFQWFDQYAAHTVDTQTESFPSFYLNSKNKQLVPLPGSDHKSNLLTFQVFDNNFSQIGFRVLPKNNSPAVGIYVPNGSVFQVEQIDYNGFFKVILINDLPVSVTIPTHEQIYFSHDDLLNVYIEYVLIDSSSWDQLPNESQISHLRGKELPLQNERPSSAVKKLDWYLRRIMNTCAEMLRGNGWIEVRPASKYHQCSIAFLHDNVSLEEATNARKTHQYHEAFNLKYDKLADVIQHIVGPTHTVAVGRFGMMQHVSVGYPNSAPTSHPNVFPNGYLLPGNTEIFPSHDMYLHDFDQPAWWVTLQALLNSQLLSDVIPTQKKFNSDSKFVGNWQGYRYNFHTSVGLIWFGRPNHGPAIVR